MYKSVPVFAASGKHKELLYRLTNLLQRSKSLDNQLVFATLSGHACPHSLPNAVLMDHSQAQDKR